MYDDLLLYCLATNRFSGPFGSGYLDIDRACFGERSLELGRCMFMSTVYTAGSCCEVSEADLSQLFVQIVQNVKKHTNQADCRCERFNESRKTLYGGPGWSGVNKLICGFMKITFVDFMLTLCSTYSKSCACEKARVTGLLTKKFDLLKKRCQEIGDIIPQQVFSLRTKYYLPHLGAMITKRECICYVDSDVDCHQIFDNCATVRYGKNGVFTVATIRTRTSPAYGIVCGCMEELTFCNRNVLLKKLETGPLLDYWDWQTGNQNWTTPRP